MIADKKAQKHRMILVIDELCEDYFYWENSFVVIQLGNLRKVFFDFLVISRGRSYAVQ